MYMVFDIGGTFVKYAILDSLEISSFKENFQRRSSHWMNYYLKCFQRLSVMKNTRSKAFPFAARG